MMGWLKSKLRKNSLTTIDKDTITSTEGWRLKFMGILPPDWKLHYFEGEKLLEISVETGEGGPRGLIFCVYLSAIKSWQPPYDRRPLHETDHREPFTESDNKRVAKNIRAGMRSWKYYCRIQ